MFKKMYFTYGSLNLPSVPGFVPVSEVVRLSRDPRTRITECLERMGIIIERRDAAAASLQFGDKKAELNLKSIGYGVTVNLGEIENVLRGGITYQLSAKHRKMLMSEGFNSRLRKTAEKNPVRAMGDQQMVLPPTMQNTFPYLWKLVNPNCESVERYFPTTHGTNFKQQMTAAA